MKEIGFACPLCGSRQLFVNSSSRKIYIEHDGEKVPLLTVNGTDRPVIQSKDSMYHCACAWSGAQQELAGG